MYNPAKNPNPLLFRFLALIIFSLFSLSNLHANVPNEVNYQGRLNEYNQPVTGTRKMSFVIFDASSGGNQMWSSGDVNVPVSGGIFSQIISPTFDLRGGDYFLELWISDKKLAPREKLTSNWYALHARTAEDVEQSSGQNIHFAIGSSTIALISGIGLELKSGGIKFPDSTVMTSAGAGAAVSLTNNSDAVITGDADSNGSGKISLMIGSAQKMQVANSGEVKSLLGGSTFYMVPRNGIIMWSGLIAAIPPGWGLCDGKWYDPTNLTAGQLGQASSDPSHYVQTPDLTDRFMLSVANSSENPGTVGGASTITISVANLPSHTHTGSSGYQSADHTHTGGTGVTGAHVHDIYGGPNGYPIVNAGSPGANAVGNNVSLSGNTQPKWQATSEGDHSHTFTTGGVSVNHYHSFTTDSAGAGTSLDIRPVFFKLAFIMKL